MLRIGGLLLLISLILILIPVTVSASFTVTVPTDPINRYINEEYDEDGNLVEKTWTIYTFPPPPPDEDYETIDLPYDFEPGKFYINLSLGSYYVSWLLCPQNMTGAPCDRMPLFDENQEWVIFDPENGPYLIGSEKILPESDCCMRNMRLRDGVPTGDRYPSIGDWEVPFNGTRYYARVDGDRVYFAMDPSVKPGTYLLHIQEIGYDPIDGGDYAAVNVPITIQYGEMAIDEPKETSYVYGDKVIDISGNNTDSDTTFLWIKGQNLPKCGVNLNDIKSKDPFRSFVVKNGLTAGNWKVYNWDPYVLGLGPGSYEIWASSVNPDEIAFEGCGDLSISGTCALQECPTCGINQTKLVMLTEPTNEVYVTPDPVERCCCPGEPCGVYGGIENIWLEGKSQGDYADNYEDKILQLWIFSDNTIGDEKFLQIDIPMLCDGSYKINLNDIFRDMGIYLCDMYPGRYYVLVQNPMYNKVFDVMLSEKATGGVLPDSGGYVVKTNPVKWSKAFIVDGVNELKGHQAFEALKSAIDEPGIDDTYAETSFVIKDNPCAKSVDFKGYPLQGFAPLIVKFEGNVSDLYNVNKWEWDFDSDGEVDSNDRSPSFTYENPGYYTVSVKVTDGFIERENKKYSYINVLAPLKVDFDYTPKDIWVNDITQFFDLSSDSAKSWEWDFGDGVKSGLQSPTHIFKKAGDYRVTLTVSDKNGIGNRETKTINVKGDPLPPLKAIFRAEITDGAKVQFIDESFGEPTSWLWDFGDGNVSSEQNPVHTYLKEGTYLVTLFAKNELFEDSVSRELGIR